jgi:hypothetical protein
MPQDDFQAFLEEERRRRKKPAPSVSTAPKDDFQAFLQEERQTPAPAPKPQRQTPVYVPPAERQQFGVRLPDIETTIASGWRGDQGRMARENAELAERSKTLRFERPTSEGIGAAERCLKSLSSDPDRLSLLRPEERRFLAPTIEDERRKLPIERRQAPAGFLKERKPGVPPGTKMTGADIRSQAANFNAAPDDRRILEFASDPAQAANFTEREWDTLQTAAGDVRQGVRDEQRRGRIAELAAQREAEKAAALGYGEQLANRFVRGAVGTGASALRGATLLDPNVESDPRLQAFAPENVQDLTRHALPVDPTDESFFSKGVEAAGSAVPFVMGSAAAGAAGAPAWIAPLPLRLQPLQPILWPRLSSN